MPELVERRILGALRCIDRATGFVLRRPFNVTSGNATLIRNRSNLYVIKTAIGLETHTEAFAAAPALPDLGSISIKVQVDDPLHKYLPRTITIDLPRDPNPDNSTNEDSLFNPVDVSLYPAPNAALLTNWSTVRVSVMRNDPSHGLVPVKGSLLRIVRISDSEVLSSSLTDDRGEALIIVSGVPITQFADDDEDENPDDGPGNSVSPVIVSELSVRLETSIESNLNWPVNPDFLESNHLDNLVNTETLTLRTGRTEKVAIELN